MNCPNCHSTNINFGEVNEFQNSRECLTCGCLWELKHENTSTRIIKQGKQILLG